MLAKLIKPGNRTYTLSAVVLLCAILLQANAEEIIHLAPILRLIVTMILTLTAPLVPVFIRKALPKDYRKP